MADAKNPDHWAAQNERGSRLFLAITTLMVRWLPAFLMQPCIWFVVLYFYITAPKQRRNIARYQARLKAAFPDVKLPARMPVLKQFIAFGQAICDRFAVWQRKIRYADLVLHDPDNVYADIDDRSLRGQILVCSHLGNVEVCRALVSHHKGFKLNVLVHSRHAQAFNEALTKAGADEIQLIQVTDLDASVMMELHNRLDQGEWIAIAADRVPVRGAKTVPVRFLGKEADMPQGAWLLAGLLKTRVNTLFCIMQNGRYHLKLQRFIDCSNWKRGERNAAVTAAAQSFADRLAEECAAAPLQWFNFYDFWKDETHG
ncbi:MULTISPECIES: glycosyl transferase family 2 [unclassified Neisseria]|uniref:LpxL/LpxP family acyltransferase n=1 Tax=unclassified Neisseria TaxID=2623750 RepID=UPI002664F375|nr:MULTISPECIES: glycosyl transferase family 2 [unclassified Neisseria]MDO1509340.1 glycosyl transferase family 2 [Neisseria sp. MVDL19-042950]MDO1515381.1 glycosyl transferase family 2 [Neisseria sp. MVDL18-041461]MDO1562741.1 glycosyl transferase family 2 [Neisseria sp. MVDL20-010259]